MSNRNTAQSTKLRSVVLTVLLVASAFTGVAALSGTVQASTAGNTHTVGENGDFATIQDAVDAADSGDRIEVTPGEYDGATITTDDIELVSVGDGTATITGQVFLPSEAEGLDVGSVSEFELRGFEVVASGQSAALDVQTGGTSDAPVRDVVFADNTFVAPDSGYAVFQGGNAENVTYEGNTFTVADGATANKLVYVGGARTYDTERAATEIDFVDNDFTGATSAIETSASDGVALEHEATDSTIRGNDFTAVAADEGDNLVTTFGADTSLSANEGVSVRSPTALSTSLQPVVAFAEEETTVTLGSGTYDGATITTDGVSIVGSADATVDTSQQGITVNGAEDVTISDLRVEGDTGANSFAVTIRNGGSAAVEDTTFDGVYGAVQTLSDGSSVVVDNITVSESVAGVGLQSDTNDVVRNSDFEVNSQGIGVFTSDNTVVENNDVTVDTDLLESDPVFDVSRAIDTQATNVTIENNRIESDEAGVKVEGGSDLTVASNTFEDTERPLEQSVDLLEPSAFVDANTLERVVFASSEQDVYSTIDSAVGSAESESTVTVRDGTYVESVAIEKPLTLVGVDRPTIEGRIDVRHDDVAVKGFEITNPGVGSSSGEVEAIFVGQQGGDGFGFYGGDVVIENVSIDGVSPGDSQKTVEAIHAKSYDGNRLGGVVIRNVSIEDVSQPAAGADGLKLQANIDGATIRNLTVDDVEGRWAYGIVATPSSVEGGVPEDTNIFQSTITNVTATEYSGVGLGVDGSDEGGYASANQLTVGTSTFVDNDVAILNKNPDETLRAVLNWYGTPDGPVTERVQGDVVYDPFLTASPETVTNLESLTAYGHDATIPADGKFYTIAFPAPVEGTVSEVFSDLADSGNVYAYNASTGTFESGADIADREITSLDAFLVQNTGDEPARITFDYAGASEPTTPGQTELVGGEWNLVGAPRAAETTDTAFAERTSNAGVITSAAEPTGVRPFVVPPVGEGYGGPPELGRMPANDIVSPYEGHWVFASGDGTVVTELEPDPSLADESRILLPPQFPERPPVREIG